jgi:hypothetical protein
VAAGDSSPMTSQRYARIAGLCYLIGALFSLFGQIVIPEWLVVANDPAATASNIRDNGTLYRFAAVAAFMAVPFHMVWAAIFYWLFRPVSKGIALLATFALLLACATWTVAFVFALAPFLILRRPGWMSAFSPEQLDTFVLLFWKLDARTFDIGLIFFGMWCLTIGYLIARSTFMPRAIGLLQMVAGIGYLTLTWQPLSVSLYPFNLAVAAPGEVSLVLWLLIKGVQVDRAQAGASDET